MAKQAQQVVTLFQWVWNAYFKASLIPLLVLEIALISVYFLSNRFSTHENINTIRAVAERELGHLASREANGINHQLLGISSATHYLQDYATQVMSGRLATVKEDPKRFVYSPEGAYYTTRDTGGSAVFYTGIVPIGKTERDKAMRSAGLDPVLVGVKINFPLVAQTYINTFDSLNRIYPYFDVIKQYPAKMDIPSYNFYYEADAKHNPSRGIVWTDVYIDPAGLGWMTSCIAPVYHLDKPDFLEGVMGVDITIRDIIEDVLKLEIPWHGYGVLISRNGTILALPESAEADWGVQGMTKSNYTGSVNQDTFRAEQFNVYNKPDIANAIKNAEQGIMRLSLNGTSIVAWATIPSTHWKIMIVAPEDNVFKPANALADSLNHIALLMIFGMLVFYSLFFIMLFQRSKKMSQSISEPLNNIDTIVNEIAQGKPVSRQYAFVVKELGSTAMGILNMGEQLESAKQARDEAAQELNKKSEQLQVIFDVSPSGYFLINDREEIILCNNALTHLTGISKEDLLSMRESDFISQLSTQASSPLELLTAPYNIHRIELVRPRPSTLLCGIRIIALENNTVLGKVYFFHDITKDEEIDRIKNDFLAHATHELRTPLSSILGYSELLTSGQIPAEMQGEVCSMIHKQSQHLVKMISELLDLTKIAERAGVDFTILPHPLNELIEEVITDFTLPANRPPIIFHLLPQSILINADRPRLKQALFNILDNAFKYSGDQQVVTIQLRADDELRQIEIEIIDLGEGMDSAQVAQAFDRFYRGDKSGNIPGTGLGLSLAKEIIVVLNGSIHIDSELGAGTRVTVTLPFHYDKK